MLAFIFRRVLMSLLTALGVVTLVFLLLRVLPGDPASMILGEYATKEAIQQVREQLGLNRPLILQYGSFLADLLRGDLGTSLLTRRPVAGDVFMALPHTVRLTVLGIVISGLVGLPLGILSAQRRNTALDQASRITALAFVSMPEFVIAILLLLVFSLGLDWFPATGAGDPRKFGAIWHHLTLPAWTVGTHYAAIMARMTRSTVLEVLCDDYIRTARAKGLVERVVFYKHALRNALIPVVTVMGLNMGRMLGGAVVVERVFSRDGIGTILIDSLLSRDYAVVQGVIVVFAVGVAVVNLTVDLAYALIDPRVRFS